MNDGEPLGQRLARGGGVVMVGDDEVEAGALGRRGGLHCRNAAIDRNHDSCALRGEPLEGGRRQAVTLVAVRNVGGQVGLWGDIAEDVEEDRGGRDAVHVVVAVDDDAFPVAKRGEQPGGRGVDAGEEPRVVQVGEFGVQECLNGRGVGVATCRENAGEQRRARLSGGVRAKGPATGEAARLGLCWTACRRARRGPVHCAGCRAVGGWRGGGWRVHGQARVLRW